MDGGYGYPVSIYYGDILLYIPALLRLVGFSVEQAYKIYLFFINMGTTIIIYTCFYKIIKDSRAALLGTAGYVLGTYRLMDIYARFALGEYSAMMFFPLVLLAIYQIYTEDETDFRKYIKNAIILAVIVYIAAIIMTVAMNLFFLVSFLDYSKNVSVNVLDNSQIVSEAIQSEGAYIGQYFMCYKEAFGYARADFGSRAATTPGIVFMTILGAGIFFCIKYKDKMIKFITLISILTLWMASNIFP